MIRPPAPFFVLVFVMSVPFYILGATGSRLPGLSILPASALMTFVPLIAAVVLNVYRQGYAGVAGFAKRMLWPGSCPRAIWYLTAVLFMPAVCILEFGVLRITDIAIPLPVVAPGEAMLVFAAFFVGAIGEEVGWQGFAYPALRSRLSVLKAAMVLGSVWALWHVIPFVQLGRSIEWIVWHSLSAIALRIIIIWLFENTAGSVLVAVLFHTMINVSWALFPVGGSFYNPGVTFAILMFAVGLIIALWGSATLARLRPPIPNSLRAGTKKGPPHD